MHYKLAILGGTFDRFHIGHQKLIDTAFEQSTSVIIGISKPPLYQHKPLAEQIESYLIRVNQVKKYLQQKNYISRSTIIPIVDIYGNTLTEKSIEAIFATEENLPNLHLINKGRLEKGLTALQTIIVPYILGTDGQIVTSARIRLGEIDRTGHSYKKMFANKTFVLPDLLREALRKPIGKIVTNIKDIEKIIKKNTFIIAVGDIVTLSLLQKNYYPAVSIIDYTTQRHQLTTSEIALLDKLSYPRKVSVNKHGMIEKDASESVNSVIQTFLQTRENQLLVIKGEEDLLTLPAILFAPLGSLVLYGQFNRGAIAVVVTEEKKQKIKKLLRRFSLSE